MRKKAAQANAQAVPDHPDAAIFSLAEECVAAAKRVDETGAVQPERSALVKARGTNGYVHYTAIVAWQVDEDGHVRHVYA